VQAVGRLYQQPDAARWRGADDAVREGITAAVAAPAVRKHLYQLYSALHDDESPFAKYIPPPSLESVHTT
jgi:hypothetical protein